VHRAESPAKSRLRPVGAELLLRTEKVASMEPSLGRKKICTARLAATSLSMDGSLGLSAGVPAAVEVKMPSASFTSTVLVTSFPELGRRGVL